MRFSYLMMLALAAVLALAGPAQATFVTYADSVSFTSDLEADKNIVLPSFDNMGGTRTLLDVIVEFGHSGKAEPAADNDDPFQGASVRARVIRQWSGSGPGVGTFGSNTVNSPFISLDPDDGDGGNNDVFDPTAPDGHDFGILGYGPLTIGPFNPAEALYDTPAPNTVTFTITPTLMVNDLQFQDPPGTPDAWQLEVENPLLTVEVSVTYEYIPEPATASLLSLGALLVLRRRRK